MPLLFFLLILEDNKKHTKVLFLEWKIIVEKMIFTINLK